MQPHWERERERIKGAIALHSSWVQLDIKSSQTYTVHVALMVEGIVYLHNIYNIEIIVMLENAKFPTSFLFIDVLDRIYNLIENKG